MSSRRRKRSTANIQPVPGSTPYHPYYSPQYGYMPPSYYTPSYEHPGYTYDQSNYIYYPVDQYGRVVGPPTQFPPIGSHIYYEHSPHSAPISTIPNQGSFIHSPRQDRRSHNDYYYHHHSPPPPRHHRAREKSIHETLPPIQRHPFASTRPLSPNDDGELRFAVRDLTENGSASSVLSHNAAIKSIKHYNKLQKSYS